MQGAATVVSAQDFTPSPEDAGTASRYRFADVEFDELEGQLRLAGRPIVVEPRPLRLLLELLRHVGEVVTKEELLDTVWEGRPTVDHVLANAVSKLRTALGEQGAARLVTVPRVGYRLAGPVQRLPARAPEFTLQAGQPVAGREAYVLERPLGQGQHSDVWLARHSKLGQAHVFKFATEGARLSALKREYTLYRVLAQELGVRDDFARVLDCNFAAAPFFIECEFGGHSLLEWAETGGALASLPTAARIRLFLHIARAVSAAHSVGVLHKDLKPGNILVGANAQAAAVDETVQWPIRLTDFGSGRLLDPARLEGLQVTALGLTHTQAAGSDSRSGTLIYLAPELLAGQPPTVQSDVYALGLMLWQLLAGDLKRPLATGWQREVPDELLRADISAATEGRLEDRIKTVAELADRLARLPARRAALHAAAAQAVLAAATAAEMHQRRARRPWLLGAAASLAVGLVASVALGVQARSALQQAQQQSARADAINAFMNEDFLTGIDGAGVGPEGTVSMRAVLERAAARAADRFKDQPATEALVRGQLAGVFHMLSMFERSEAEYRRALSLADPQAVRSDPALLKMRFDLIANLAVHNKLAEAKKLLADAERDAGGAALAGTTALARSAALARFMVLHSGEQFKQALAAGEALVALVDQRAGAGRPDDWFTARAMVGDTLYHLGQLAQAETLLAGIVVPRVDGPAVAVVTLARVQVLLARVRLALGKTDAEADMVAARDVLLGRVGADEHYVNVANTELASLLDTRGDFAASRNAFAALYDSNHRALGPQHPSTRVMGLNLAIAELNLGHPQQALQELDAGRSWFVSYAGGEQGAVVQAIDFERARAMTGLGRAAEAVPLLARLDAKVVAAAAPARDWEWRLQAERGRALLAGGTRAERAEGLRLVQSALLSMQAHGSAPWVLAGYRKLVGESSVVAARP